MDAIKKFVKERMKAIEKMSKDDELKRKSLDWIIHADKYNYTYNFKWLGRPIIKYPNDIIVLQEIIWDVKPDLIIETGIAHGGSVIFSASMLELIGSGGEVIAIDIDIRDHNRKEIEKHPLYKRITLFEGDSTSEDILKKIKKMAKNKKTILVILDSNHTHNHVLKELTLYSPFVTKGSYIIAMDSFIEKLPEGHITDRPWGVGNNPYTAIQEFISKRDDFQIDEKIEKKLLISETLNSFLKRIK